MNILRRAWIILSLMAFSGAAFTADNNVRLDIAPQSLGAALNEFARQSGLQVFLSAEEGAGVMTKKVSGTYTPKAALEMLLSGTGLAYEFLNDRTIAVRQKGQTPTPAQDTKAWLLTGGEMRLAQVPAPQAVSTMTADPGMQPASLDAQPEGESKEIVVTGSRIRSTAGDSAHPVVTYTQEDLQRFGITSVADIKRLIPQLGSVNKNEGSGTFGRPPNGNLLPTPASARVTASLRGLPNNSTLILVDGQRLSRTGQSEGGDNYDLGGIPVSAIDRIEVLSAGASAVYGADAIAGAINIILKKGHSGLDATASWDGTFDGGGGIRSVSLAPGFTFGKLSGLASFSALEQNQLKATDRWFTESDDKTSFGGADSRSTIPGGRGYIIAANLPGLSGSQAAIPLGSNGMTTTVADYANSGPISPRFDQAAYQNLIDPRRETSGMLRLQYELPGSGELFMDGRWSERKNHDGRVAPPQVNLSVPAGYPGNPFNIPVRVVKTLFDYPEELKETVIRLRDWAGTAGVRGDLPAGWEYQVFAHWTRSKLDDHRYRLTNAAIQAAVNSTDPNAIHPNILDDSTTGPSPISLEQYMGWLNVFPSSELSDNLVYSAQADGALFHLPTGAVKGSLTAEYTDEQVRFLAVPADSASPNAIFSDSGRSIRSFVGEVVVPLAPRDGLPLLHRLEAGIQGRHDTYSDFGSKFSPGFSLLYAPADWLMLRGSTSTGFKVPSLSDLKGPARNAAFFLQSQLDPVTNTLLTGIYPSFLNPNPNLKPERSTSINFGAVLNFGEVGLVNLNGLTLSVDHFDIDYKDRSIRPSPADIFIFFPERAIRNASGVVTAFDQASVNFASLRAKGWDYRSTYDLATQWGDLAFQASYSRPSSTVSQSTPLAPPVTQDMPDRGTASVFWSRGPLEAGVNAHYQSTQKRLATPLIWASELGYDPQIAWTFGPETAGTSGLSRMLAGSRVSLTVFNAIYKEVSIREAANALWVVDPRLRRYALNLTKSF